MKATPNSSFHKASGRWCAYVSLTGKRRHLGLFDTQGEADAAVHDFKIANDIEIDESADMRARVVYVGGLLVWRQHGRGHAKGDVVGSIDKATGYAFTRDSNGKKTYLHRVVWELMRGPIPEGMQIDHINHDRADNRIENLRVVTQSLNLKNRSKMRPNATGHRGVHRRSDGKFLARVWTDGKVTRLGAFDSAEAAGAARREAEPAHGYHPNHGGSAS